MESLKSIRFEKDVKFTLYYEQYNYKVLIVNSTNDKSNYSHVISHRFKKEVTSDLTKFFPNTSFKLRKAAYKKLWVYIDDLDAVQFLLNTYFVSELFKVELKVVDDVMYFKRKPKGNYRIYFKQGSFKLDEFLEFDEKIRSNKNVTHRNYVNTDNYNNYYKNRKTVYLCSSDYIDLLDKSDLITYKLIYDVFLGKSYKLELKTENS